jgi:DNA-binding NtrC family response regulator
MSKKGLEETIKEKVSSLLEKSMEKNLGITIPKIENDITSKLSNPSLNIYIPSGLTFNSAKKFFKKEFLQRQLFIHKGNISKLAKTLRIDRRTIHRTIKEIGIDIEKIRKESNSFNDYEAEIVDHTLKNTFEQYKTIINPTKIEKMYENIHSLSKDIAKILPLKEISWKDAEKSFEIQFLKKSLGENNNNVLNTAKQIKIRPETLHRKIKILGLNN